jgi:hypothetical protein
VGILPDVWTNFAANTFGYDVIHHASKGEACCCEDWGKEMIEIKILRNSSTAESAKHTSQMTAVRIEDPGQRPRKTPAPVALLHSDCQGRRATLCNKDLANKLFDMPSQTGGKLRGSHLVHHL